jgi:membrane protease YdiL (CAAX protease family)
LLFRALANWRGGLTAAIGSGIIFGAVAYLLFQESYTGSIVSAVYFILWGILYGVIRLRTGSLIGIAVIQALHSFTAWVVMVPQSPVLPSELQSLYLAASAAYLILIWRLWPKEEGDYRI